MPPPPVLPYLRRLWSQLSGSLFALPTVIVAAFAGLAYVTILLDRTVGERADLPAFAVASVDSARAVLTTAATTTITVAGVAFSIALLTIQLASAQFSPRVLRTFFRDLVTKVTIGVAVGTFAFCLIVLNVVRQPTEGEPEAFVPNVAVLVATALGVATILLVMAFLSHSAHSMQVSQIIRRVTRESLQQVRRICPPIGERPAPRLEAPEEQGCLVVTAAGDGWVQQVEFAHLALIAPESGTVRLDTYPGTFVFPGAALCTIWPAPPDRNRAEREARRRILLGPVRTMQQDMAFGIRQLVDIGARALSPGTNDPTTAREAIEHIGVIVREILLRDLPPAAREADGDRKLIVSSMLSHRDYVMMGFGEIRPYAVPHFPVVTTMVETLGFLSAELAAAQLSDRAALARDEAHSVLRAFETSRPLAEELEHVRAAARRWELIE